MNKDEILELAKKIKELEKSLKESYAKVHNCAGIENIHEDNLNVFKEQVLEKANKLNTILNKH